MTESETTQRIATLEKALLKLWEKDAEAIEKVKPAPADAAAGYGYGRVVEKLLPAEWEKRTGRTIKVHLRDMTTYQRATLDTFITLPSYLAFLRRLDLRRANSPDSPCETAPCQE